MLTQSVLAGCSESSARQRRNQKCCPPGQGYCGKFRSGGYPAKFLARNDIRLARNSHGIGDKLEKRYVLSTPLPCCFPKGTVRSFLLETKMAAL